MTYKRSDDTSYALGMSISMELVKDHPEVVTRVIYAKKIYKDEAYRRLEGRCLEKGIPFEEDDKTIDRLSAKENCYVIAFFKKFQRPLANDRRHLILAGIEDEGQLGTLIRTAISFDQRDIVLIGDIDYLKPAIIRSSMGAIFYASIATYPDIATYRKDYPEHTVSKYEMGAADLRDTEFGGLCSLLFGTGQADKSFGIAKAKKAIGLPIACGISLSYLYAKELYAGHR